MRAHWLLAFTALAGMAAGCSSPGSSATTSDSSNSNGQTNYGGSNTQGGGSSSTGASSSGAKSSGAKSSGGASGTTASGTTAGSGSSAVGNTGNPSGSTSSTTMSAGSSGGGSSTTGGGNDNEDGGPASAATSTTVGNGCTPPAQYENLFITLLGQTQASSDAKLAAAWNQLFNPSNANTVFYTGPLTGEAYVKDVADNDVRTEGQSYGMMISLQLNHQTEFDELWAFAKHYMAQPGGGYAWHVSTSGSVLATGGAPDGDEWFAAALVFAHYRWGDTSGKYNYGTEAQTVLNMVRTTDFDSTNHLVRYYSGTSSNGTDGSYNLPAYYQTWACFDTANAAFWNAVVTASRAFFHAAAGSNGVIGDQSSFTGATTNSSGDDKLRCVANIMSDHNFFNADPWQTMTYAPEYGMHESSGTTSTAELACDGLLGFGLPSSTGKPFVQNLWNVAIPSGNYRYYDGTLYTLALLHVSGAFHLWYGN